MRSVTLSLSAGLLSVLCSGAATAQAEPLAESLVGTWTCESKEGENDVAMTLNYQRSDDWLIGEMKEANGAALLDVWLDEGPNALVLRRILSYDATIEMEVVEEAPTWVKLEGEMRHVLGSSAKVREEIRFNGTEAFHAVWEADSGDGWELILERNCKRI